MPSTRPRTSWAPSADLSQIPACRALSRSVSRRIRAITSARAISTTERVLENGALKTATPRWAAARRSIWLVPMQKAPIARRSVACARTRSVTWVLDRMPSRCTPSRAEISSSSSRAPDRASTSAPSARRIVVARGWRFSSKRALSTDLWWPCRGCGEKPDRLADGGRRRPPSASRSGFSPQPRQGHHRSVLSALLLENLHPLATTILRADGAEVLARSGALDEDELISALEGVHLLGIRSKTQVTERVLAQATDLRAIGAFCIGTNQIDLRAAAQRGVAVFNAPFSNTRSVVEIALAEVIALMRRLTDRDRALHAGIWDKSADGAHEVRGRVLGIVGYGNIGTQLSVLAEALGMSVVFYDTAERLALGNARRLTSMDELLKMADVVTLHVDGRPGNAGLFGGAEQPGVARPAVHVQGDDVGHLEELVHAGEPPGVAKGEPLGGVVEHHRHAQCLGEHRELRADVPVADDAQH